MGARNDELFELVCDLLAVLEIEGLERDRIEPSSDLIDDVGMDSLKFVDLTVALERALRVESFPMQEWIDRRIERGQPLTVGALVAACRGLGER